MGFVSTLDKRLPWQEPEQIAGGLDALIIGGSGEFDFDGGRDEYDEVRLMLRRLAKRLKPVEELCLRYGVPDAWDLLRSIFVAQYGHKTAFRRCQKAPRYWRKATGAISACSGIR